MSLLREISQIGLVQTNLKKSNATDAGKSDVTDKAVATNDVKFNLMRNTINTQGEVTGSDVASYLNRAAELNDEVDTVPFGLETDDGEIVKVYVNADQADEFESAMKNLLGIEDDIEEAITRLAAEFDIIDVVWPDDDNQDNDDEFAELDLDDPLDRDIPDDDLDSNVEVVVSDDQPDEADDQPDEADDEDLNKSEDNSEDEDLNNSEEEIKRAAEDDDDSKEKKKAKAKKKAEKTLTPEGVDMSIGSNFLQRVLNEASKPGEDIDAVNDGLNIPLDGQQKALMSKMKKQLEKKIVYLFVITGIPGRYLNTAELEDGVKSAADMLRKQVSIRRQFDKLYLGLGTAKGFAIPPEEVKEAKTRRGGLIQKMFASILVELGLPEPLINTSGPATIGQFLMKTAKIIEQDTELEQTLRQLAIRMGIKSNDLLGEAIDPGADPFAEVVFGLIADLGIPDNVLQVRRASVIKAIREKKMSLQNRSEVLRKINILRIALNKTQTNNNEDY